MTEAHRPRLSADHLTAVLHAEMSRHRPPADAAPFSLVDLETLLRAAEERARPRTQLPPQLHHFPFTWSPLRQLLLKVHKRLFHDQRAVNTVLIQALRETLAVNRYLVQALAEQGRAPAPTGLRLLAAAEEGDEVMRVVVATVQVPFARGGAEVHAEGLRDALQAAGHEADLIAVPFNSTPAERIPAQMLACRLLDLTQSNGVAVDVVIGLKFPAYLVRHPRKVLWVLHQHRAAYDLWGEQYGDLIYVPHGMQVRNAIRQADRQLIPEARGVFANSRNVARRLKQFCDIDSTPLYHPPRHAELFHGEAAEDYLFFPSRLAAIKRQALVVEALAHTRQPVRVCFAGTADFPPYERELQRLAGQLRVQERIRWLGHISEVEKRRLYARAVAVLYPPRDEDFGYVTLEAMLSAKPVLTCSDSGGPLEFVQPRRTGLVVEPTSEDLASAMDEVWRDRAQARAWGTAGRAHYERLDITWPRVVRSLLSCA